VPGYFPLLTDIDVDGRVVRGLLRLGWDIVRVVDTFPGTTLDDVLFEESARQNRVFVTNDKRIHRLAVSWIQTGRSFRMVFWAKKHHDRMTIGEFLEAFEELARREKPFSYPIEYIKPRP